MQMRQADVDRQDDVSNPLSDFEFGLDEIESPRLSPKLIAKFSADRCTALTREQWSTLHERAVQQHKEFQSHFEENSGNMRLLEAMGESQISIETDPLNGRPSEIAPELTQRALVLRQIYLSLLTHPTRLTAQVLQEQGGFKPILNKRIPALDFMKVQKVACAYDDFTRGVAPTPGSDDSEHRTSVVLAGGTFSFVNDRFTANYVNGSSMPEWGPFANVTVLLSGSTSYIPTDGLWANSDARDIYIERMLDLLDNDPIFDSHLFEGTEKLPNEMSPQEFIRERALRNLGCTVKPRPEVAIEEISRIRDKFGDRFPINKVRVYDPRATFGMIETVKALRNEFGDDLVIDAGQVVVDDQEEPDLETAYDLQEAGANALIVGIGSGGVCQTPRAADIHGRNVQTVYEIAKSDEIKIPVVAEAGVGSNFGVLMAVGGAGNNATGKLLAGTIEQPPVLFWRETPDGKFVAKDYWSEACPETKTLGGNVDLAGYAQNVEGQMGWDRYEHYGPSIAMRMWQLHEGFAKTALMQRVTSISELTHQTHPAVFTKSEAARKEAGVHGSASRDRSSRSIEYYQRLARAELEQNTGKDLDISDKRVEHPWKSY